MFHVKLGQWQTCVAEDKLPYLPVNEAGPHGATSINAAATGKLQPRANLPNQDRVARGA